MDNLQVTHSYSEVRFELRGSWGWEGRDLTLDSLRTAFPVSQIKTYQKR